MKIILAAILILPLSALAQFIYHPLPFKQSDFSKINQLKYTRCLVYQDIGGEKVLAGVAEYGNMGMIAAIHEKGTNDAGDSVNTSSSYFKFDSKGRLVRKDDEDIEYGESRTAYTYDGNGRLIKKQVAEIDPPTYTYKYDQKGKLTQVDIKQRFPEVDENGESTGKSFDKPTYRYTYKYDNKGRLSEEQHYQMVDGKFAAGTLMTWSYDNNGRVASVKRLNSDGEVLHETTYTYDANGLLTRSSEKNDLGEEKLFVYEYDKEKPSWMK